jgi:hypothetical protein
MKRLIAALTALAMLAGGGATPSGMAEAAEAAESCCWIYCESIRDGCWFTFREDREYCDAWYQGCIDGCQYPGGPTSGGGGAF